MKTKADYEGESKKAKLRSPKIAEFSISIIEGVSERLKVRRMSVPQPLSHASSHFLISGNTPTHTEATVLTFLCCHNPTSAFYITLPCGSSTAVLPVISQGSTGKRHHNDSLNPALTLSLIQLLPWQWPPNGNVSSDSFKPF